MAVKIQVEVFRVVTPCSDVVGYRLDPEDGGSKVGISLLNCVFHMLQLVFTQNVC
jgi:hypothetical protein